ncbi:MAG: phosphoglucosamine mutase [Halieaceae bacterium]|jgi:phosphoglucosamine mutase|nr:phosphoglucosamine mutase [Halieaceae bacterium]
MTKRYFGTDGIRGRVGEPPITPDFMLKLGWACGRVFASGQAGDGRPCVIIGKDTRVSGYMFESALEAGLVAAGVDVKLLGPMPTPAVALMTRSQRARAGIVISASHNPFEDNGIKFFDASGHKLGDELELAIEAELEKPLETVASNAIGKAVRVGDAAGRYIEFCKSTVPAHFSLRGLKLVVDCANGATYHIAPSVFAELGAEVIAIGAEPDGFNINREVGSTSPAALASRVVQEGADLGIAMDGDGDRVLFVDQHGELVDGDELLFIIARHRRAKGVVGTLMSNLGMELALKDLGIDFTRARVGDRYVNELMQERGWRLGGESSGHIICADLTTTGDGIVAALQVLVALRAADTDMATLKSGMTKYPQHMINVQVAGQVNLDDNADLQAAVADTESELGDRGRVLLRASGTEPVVRVMLEGEDAGEVETLCGQLAQRVSGLLGS